MLTDRQLKAWTKSPPEKTTEVSAGGKMYARISPSGSISFQYRYRINTKQHRITLGQYPLVSLKEARDEAMRLAIGLQQGKDPKREVNNKYAQGGFTLDQCFEEWLEKHVRRHLKPSTYTNYESIYKAHFKGRYTRGVERIRADEWLATFDRIGSQSPYLAGVVLRVLKRMLGWCQRRQLIGPVEVMNITVQEVGVGTSIRHRTLEMNEVGRIWAVIESTRFSMPIRNCIKLLLLTGARNSEIRESRWSEFDLEAGLWILPAERSKIGRSIRRPLTKEMIVLLEQLRVLPGDEWVFPSPDNDFQKPITTHGVQKAVHRIRARLNIPEWRVHDFRRTIATRLSEQGVQPHVIEKMLGHSLGGVLAVYNRHDWIDEQRQAYELWYTLITRAAQASAGR